MFLNLVCVDLIFSRYKANLPMRISGPPERITYVEFIQGWHNAIKTVNSSQYVWRMMRSLTTRRLIYIVVYKNMTIRSEIV